MINPPTDSPGTIHPALNTPQDAVAEPGRVQLKVRATTNSTNPEAAQSLASAYFLDAPSAQ
jgi:hypothetical protein